MNIISIEPIVWETMIPTPGEFTCFVDGCDETATKRVVIDDDAITVRLCVCPLCCSSLSAVEMLERTIGRKDD